MLAVKLRKISFSEKNKFGKFFKCNQSQVKKKSVKLIKITEGVQETLFLLKKVVMV